jgi:hypothetical protein
MRNSGTGSSSRGACPAAATATAATAARVTAAHASSTHRNARISGIHGLAVEGLETVAMPGAPLQRILRRIHYFFDVVVPGP